MDLPKTSKPKKTKKSSTSRLFKINGNRPSHENTKHLLKYFPKYYDSLIINITSGPLIAKLKRLKVLRDIEGYLPKNRLKNIGLALMKKQSKFLKKIPHLVSDYNDSRKEARFSEASHEDLRRYFPLFPNIQDLRLILGSGQRKITVSEKPRRYLIVLKNRLRRFSISIKNCLVDELVKLADELCKYKEILGSLKDFAVHLFGHDQENPLNLALKGHPLWKYVTYLDCPSNFPLKAFDLWTKDFEDIRRLRVNLTLRDIEKMNLNLLKRLEILDLTTKTELSCLILGLKLPETLQSLTLELCDGASKYTYLHPDTLKNFHSQWGKLDHLVFFKLVLCGDTWLFERSQEIFGPVLEKIPKLVSFEFELKYPLRKVPQLSCPIKISPFLTEKAVKNLKGLRILKIDAGIQLKRDEDSEIFKSLENLSLLSITSCNLGVFLASGILKAILAHPKKKRPFEIKMETVEIPSRKRIQAFCHMIAKVKRIVNVENKSKISMIINVRMSDRKDYELVFEEFCKEMSYVKRPESVYITLKFGSVDIENLKKIIIGYPDCPKFRVVCDSTEYTFENGALLSSKRKR